ncbi:hypothetical protein MMC21_003723 [Puttea exsequens]|nr:hypothetical protein [Puttea exsequens]
MDVNIYTVAPVPTAVVPGPGPVEPKPKPPKPDPPKPDPPPKVQPTTHTTAPPVQPPKAKQTPPNPPPPSSSSSSSSAPSSYPDHGARPKGTTTLIPQPSYIVSSSSPPIITSAPSSGLFTNSARSSASSCGQCSVLAQQVKVLYWPTGTVKTTCARGSSAALPAGPASAGITNAPNATQGLASMARGGGSIDVIDDSCGIKGGHYTNPAPFPVAAITTASYPDWPSTCRPQGGNIQAVVDTLAQSDIACPTWGVSDPFYTTCDGEVYLTATYGEPYNPVILVPTEILAIDPAWAACRNAPANGPFVLPCGLYDPPRALSTEGGVMVPGAPTPVPPIPETDPTKIPQPAMVAPELQHAQPTKPAAYDGSTFSSTDGDPGQNYDPSQNNDPGQKNDPGYVEGEKPPPSNNNPPAVENNVPYQGPQTVEVQQPAEGSPAPKPADVLNSNPAPADSQPAPAPAPAPNPGKAVKNPAPTAPIVPVPQTTINLGGGSDGGQEGAAPGSGGVGSIINSAIGGGPPQPPAAAFTPHVITPLGQTISVNNPSSVAIAGHVLSVGGPAVTTAGNFFSLASGGNLVAGTLAPAPAAFSFGGSTYTANPSSQFVIAGQTLTQGGTINVAGTNIALPSNANAVVIASSTQPLITPAPTSGPPALTFGGSTYTPNSASQFIIAGQTLTPGGSITVSGTPIALPPGANVAIIAGSTQPLTPAPSIANAPAVLTFAGATYTANAAGQIVIAGQTLTPGGAITVSGTPISEAPGTAPAFAVIGSSTQSLASATALTTEAPVLTFNGQTYTADAHSDFIIDGQTLTPGGVITVSGTPLSEAPAGASSGFVVVGSSTESLASATITPADVFTIDGTVFTANPTGFVIDGTTVVPGGPAATVDGTTVSLETGGVLDVGTSHIPLPSETAPMAFEGAGSRISAPGVLFAAWGLGLVMAVL